MKTLTIISMILCFATVSLGADDTKDIAIILKTKGTVKIQSANPKTWRIAERGMRLHSGDNIKTGENSLAAIMFTDDKSLMKVRENSALSVKGKREKATISKQVKFSLGQLWVKAVKQKSNLLVETPSGIAAVKGTEFYTLVDQDGNTTIFGIEGLVSLLNQLGEVLIRAGETGLAAKLQAPSVQKSDGSQIPNWGQEDGNDESLEFEFEDEDGNKKILKINFQEK